MVKSITVKNYLGQEVLITLNDDRPTHGLLVKKIDGFGPSKSNIVSVDYSFLPGGIYQYSKSENRNIVIEFYFSDSYKDIEDPGKSMTIEKARLNCYKYFPIGQKLDLKITTDQGSYTISGYVEKNEPNVFSNKESAQVSIICTDPFFNGSLETYDENTISSSVAYGGCSVGRSGEWLSEDQYPVIKMAFPNGISATIDLYETYGDNAFFVLSMYSYPKQGSSRTITLRLSLSFFRLCGIMDSTNLNPDSYIKLETINGAIKLTAVLYDGVSEFNSYDITSAIIDVTQDQEFKIERSDMMNQFVFTYSGPTYYISILNLKLEVITFELVDLSNIEWGYADRFELNSKTDIICGCVLRLKVLEEYTLRSGTQILELENITEGGTVVSAPGWYRIDIDFRKLLDIVDPEHIEEYKVKVGDELIVSSKTGQKYIHYKRNDVEYNVMDAAGTSAIKWIKIHNGLNKFYCSGIDYIFNTNNIATKFIEYEELHGGI